MSKIYVASSWRNTHQPNVVEALKARGHDVYDFRHPAHNNNGFSWRQCVDDEADLVNPVTFRDKVLKHPVAKAGFDLDMEALRRSDITVLVLPCGRSAHLELGFATGAKQKTVVMLDDPMSEPELMYLMNDFVCTSMLEMLNVCDFISVHLGALE